jgi:ABC-type Zn2+ transport system substrate-binding protein/surface adhesin
MKRAKWILLVLAIPFLMVPSARANDGHDDGKEHKENKKHDNDRRDNDDRRDDDGKHDNDGRATSHSSTRVPIDAGISILLIAGLGLGAKLMIDRNKKKATVI